MSAPELFVVVGPPAAGKSTFSTALAARYPRSVHVPVDDLRMMVRSGRVLPQPDWHDELATQVALARASALGMAARYRAAGFTVVVDDFVDPCGLSEYASLPAGAGVRKVVLRPSQDEALRRSLGRDGDTPQRAYIDEGIRFVYGLLSSLEPSLVAAGWTVLDTTDLTPDAAVDALLGGPPRG